VEHRRLIVAVAVAAITVAAAAPGAPANPVTDFMAALSAHTAGTYQDLRTQDELDAARSLPPDQLGAVAEGLRSTPVSGACARDESARRDGRG
jgi:hypothetical protein